MDQQPTSQAILDSADNAWQRVAQRHGAQVRAVAQELAAKIHKNGITRQTLLASGMSPIVVDAAPGTLHWGGPLHTGPRPRSRRARWSTEDVGLSQAGRRQLYDVLEGRVATIDSEATRVVRQKFGSGARAVNAILSSAIGLKHPVHGGLVLDGITPATLDDAADLFVHNELIRVLPMLLREQRVDIFARQLFPSRMLNAPGAEGWEFRVLKARGRAALTADFEGHAPRGAKSRKPIRRPLKWMWSGASWTWSEMLAAAEARANDGFDGINLNTEEVNLAREACLRLENLLLFFGDVGPDQPDDPGIHGILSPQNGINQTTGVPAFVATDPAAMLRTMLAAEARIIQSRVESPTTLALGTTDYILVHHTTWEDGDAGAGARERSVAEVFLSRAISIREIVWAPELQYEAAVEAELKEQGYSDAEAARYAGGIDKKRVMLTYTRDAAKLENTVGQDLMVRPPQLINERWDVNVLLKTGGMTVYYPRSADIVVFDA